MCSLDSRYEEEGQIGSPGYVVEIDESKVGKRKYNRGRLREGNWILGMIDRDGGYRLEICPENKRDKETLIPLIKKHVKPGTEIHTDGWAAYKGLEREGYVHEKVNHSKRGVGRFKDPITGAHTNTIEGSWKHFKYQLTDAGYKTDDLAMHMCAYLGHREVRQQNKDPSLQIMDDIKALYPTFECNLR